MAHQPIILSFIFLSMLFISSSVCAEGSEDIKNEIIRVSIESYSGNCPCPYNRDRAGRRCGKRSAYSKPGGYSPVCYPSDVTEKMIKNHLEEKE